MLLILNSFMKKPIDYEVKLSLIGIYLKEELPSRIRVWACIY